MDIKATFTNEEFSIQFLFENNLIYNARKCTCTAQMEKKTKRGKLVWVCPSCNKTNSLLHGSFFEVCKTNLKLVSIS